LKAFISKINKRKAAVSVIAVAALILGIMIPVFAVLADSPTYLALEGEGFAGQCNIRLYTDTGSRASSNTTIHYLAIYIMNQADDEDSLIMSGNWTANTTVPNGALVMAWTSKYGPYPDRDSYIAHNCSTCNVTPDYFWITYGAQGDYSTSFWGGFTKPYLTLGGIGLGIDWGEEDVTSFGQIQLRGKIGLKKVSNVTTLYSYKPQVMLQSTLVADDAINAPHQNAYTNVNLRWVENETDCWDNLIGNTTFICDWLETHFGLDICPEN
jgi:hypothetical protein